ncbi:hypothetical protein COC69_20715 [Bacillus cereus]|uniref:Uncharacterized protein n=1 Tax=Bacillus cereus TaxID=1396 RepID=A0A9X7CKR3_BACCE|nr:hypothetical protein [Bacillus cereus]PGS77206.1 hypothetical protein COC69_20715 [Bacillus cereus]
MGYEFEGIIFTNVPTGKKLKYQVLLNGKGIGTAAPYKNKWKKERMRFYLHKNIYNMNGYAISKNDNTIVFNAVDVETGKVLYSDIAKHEPK